MRLTILPLLGLAFALPAPSPAAAFTTGPLAAVLEEARAEASPVTAVRRGFSYRVPRPRTFRPRAHRYTRPSWMGRSR